jgi:hypothetical protein
MSLYRKKRIWIIVTTLILFFSVNETALCSLWGQAYLPVPAKTKAVREETRLIGAEEYLFTYFTSELTLSDLKVFYRSRLPASGWTESEPSPGMEKVKQETLFFKKGDEEIAFNFTPSVDGGKARFILCQKAASSFKEGEKSAIPELLTRPKKEVVPVYPQAKLVSNMEREGSARLTYCSTDKIEAIAQYYRNKLPALGFSLVGEDPLQEIAQDKVLMQRQSFMNAYGQKCDIILTKITLPQGLAEALKNLGAPINLDYVYIMVESKNLERGIR